ncbi:MAG: uncharacterized protein A8A55_3601, partial [Amphiamblys sp. WSBS2006]
MSKKNRKTGSLRQVTRNNSIWIGKVKSLNFRDYTVEILPKLKLHGENVMEEIVLDACRPEHITELLEMENSSIWIGKVESLNLKNYTLGILPKLRLHDENVLEKLDLYGYNPQHIVRINKKRNIKDEGPAKLRKPNANIA